MGLGIDQFEWSTLFGSSYPSVVNTQATNPHNTDISTEDTIALMEQHSYQDSQHPIIQSAIEEIKQSTTNPDDHNELIKATYQYVQDRVTFVEDETILNKLFGIDSDVELLITPARLLSMQQPMGDCDDFSSLTKSLLIGMGIDTSFITVAADKDKPKKWSHVYLLDDDSNIPIDTSHGKYLGWEAQATTREKIWDDPFKKVKKRKKEMVMDNNFLSGLDDLGDIASLGAYDYGGEYASDTPGSGGGFVGGSDIGYPSSVNWSAIFSPITQGSMSILKAQYGQPQLAPGTFIRNADGSILTNQPIQNAGLLSSTTGLTLGGNSTLIIGAIVLIGGVMLLGGKR